MHYLAANSTGARLQQLVNKWFLGLDHPGILGTGYTYQYTNGWLFHTSGAPLLYTDIKQGAVGDCYFLSALGGVAIKDPTALQSNFIDNGDGTFTIRFYNDGVADYVTVDRYLPAKNGAFVYANAGDSIQSFQNVLWVALAEKAFVQVSQEGWTGHLPDNVYSDIEAGWPAKAVRQITGWDTDETFTTYDFNSITTRFNNGEVITFVSEEPVSATNVVPGHAYLVVGYDASAHTITLFNPWGTAGGYRSGDNKFCPGSLSITAADFDNAGSNPPSGYFWGWFAAYNRF